MASIGQTETCSDNTDTAAVNAGDIVSVETLTYWPGQPSPYVLDLNMAFSLEKQ
jgi:hypothetical protein